MESRSLTLMVGSVMLKTFAAPLLAALLGAAAPPVSFTPVSCEFAQAAGEYRRLWQAEGERIAAALEAASGLGFPAGRVDVIVSEGRPMASYDGRTIRLRASYSPAYKKATLVHEMGHRLAFALPDRGGLDDHRLLYLFLYDAWTDLYGKEFADRMVGIERRIGPAYESAWTWTLAMSREQRRARLAELRGRPTGGGAGARSLRFYSLPSASNLPEAGLPAIGEPSE